MTELWILEEEPGTGDPRTLIAIFTKERDALRSRKALEAMPHPDRAMGYDYRFEITCIHSTTGVLDAEWYARYHS